MDSARITPVIILLIGALQPSKLFLPVYLEQSPPFTQNLAGVDVVAGVAPCIMPPMNPTGAAAGTVADTWDVLDRLIEDAAQLSLRNFTPEAFAHELLRRAVDALAAQAAACWEAQSSEYVLQAAYAAPGTATPLARRVAQTAPDSTRRELLDRLVRRGEPLEVAASAVVDPAVNLTNPYDAPLVAAPIVVDGTPVGAIELVLRADVGPDARQGALRVLCALADCAADFQRERQRRLWQDRAVAAQEFERLVSSLYAELDPTGVAFAAANDGRRWAECERVSVLLCEGNNARAVAVSGVDALDRRSDPIRRLERLAALTAGRDEPLWYAAGQADAVAPDLSQTLSEYIDQASTAALVVLPLIEPHAEREPAAANISPRPPLGAIVCEWFTGNAPFDELRRDRLGTLQLHTARALSRALECDSVPLGRWWRRRYRHRSLRSARLRKVALGVAIAAALVGVPFLIPAEATVEARGSLEPERRRELFAPADGVVAEIAARHGQSVAADAPLVVLRSPTLTIELTRVAGELQTAERRLSALRANRLVASSADAAARLQAQERTAEEEQVKETIRGLEEQRKLLLAQVDELTVRAPLDGIVTTWDVERILLGRPVARGQTLLGVADAAGPWVLELLVPERLIGDVLAARRAQAEPLEVEFVTATNPDKVYRGRVQNISAAAETDPQLGVVVKATVAFDRAVLDATQLRPGAAVTARIRCGPSTLGAVGGRDLRRFLQSWWW